ncbi:hypothetical protein CYMTET_31970 [Cymbomonas tetramitiformis]|uniref:Rab3 GTPase-activating protein catalytic subunit n=1 Tax=Cymbomonas tetramitiformis TaxID=36881 RepID=A0AAE0FFR5_9CHLO|nr:hypothetical protein CYMTET_31970 [Cymbomonas tetramitiformis]
MALYDRMHTCGASDGAPRFWEEVDGAHAGQDPEGVAHPLPGVYLLAPPHPCMNAPVTQAAPCFTEDMVREREAAIAALRSTAEAEESGAQLECSMLLSDMGAFKAANPGSCLGDFVRWHSPRDWVGGESTTAGGHGGGQQQAVSLAGGAAEGEAGAGRCRPRGQLSERMAAPGSQWAVMWAKAAPCPAGAQKPLMDPESEGEKVLHYLDTMCPTDLFAQLMACSCSAVADLLLKAQSSQLEASLAELQSLTRAFNSVLQRPCPYPEEYEALCEAVERAERVVALAESVHRRLPADLGHLATPLLRAAMTSDPSAPQSAPPGGGFSTGGVALRSGDDFEALREMLPKANRWRGLISGSLGPAGSPQTAAAWEHVLSISTASERGWRSSSDEGLHHRLYVRAAPGHLRVATAIQTDA